MYKIAEVPEVAIVSGPASGRLGYRTVKRRAARITPVLDMLDRLKARQMNGDFDRHLV